VCKKHFRHRARRDERRSTAGVEQEEALASLHAIVDCTTTRHHGITADEERAAAGKPGARPGDYVIPAWRPSTRRDDHGTDESMVLTYPRSLTGTVDTVGTDAERARHSGLHDSVELHTQGVQETLPAQGTVSEETLSAQSTGGAREQPSVRDWRALPLGQADLGLLRSLLVRT
jgi:hypothetical protein